MMEGGNMKRNPGQSMRGGQSGKKGAAGDSPQLAQSGAGAGKKNKNVGMKKSGSKPQHKAA